MSADPSTRSDDRAETAADADGNLPGQICDSNAAASAANTKEAATSNPPITAFPPPSETVILKMELTSVNALTQQRHYGHLVESYAHGCEIQARCCLVKEVERSVSAALKAIRIAARKRGLLTVKEATRARPGTAARKTAGIRRRARSK